MAENPSDKFKKNPKVEAMFKGWTEHHELRGETIQPTYVKIVAPDVRKGLLAAFEKAGVDVSQAGENPSVLVRDVQSTRFKEMLLVRKDAFEQAARHYGVEPQQIVKH